MLVWWIATNCLSACVYVSFYRKYTSFLLLVIPMYEVKSGGNIRTCYSDTVCYNYLLMDFFYKY